MMRQKLVTVLLFAGYTLLGVAIGQNLPS